MATISLHKALRRRALWHALGAKESVADIVSGALIEFLQEPRLSVPVQSQLSQHQTVLTFVGKPYLAGPREQVKIDDSLYSAVAACASKLDVSVETLTDLAVANECSAVEEEDLSWDVEH